MQKHAAVEFSPPEDIHDPELLQRHLREYIVANINAWMGGRRCSLWTLFAALKDTYAIDQKRYAVAASRKQSRAATAGRDVKNDTYTVRYVDPQTERALPARC